METISYHTDEEAKEKAQEYIKMIEEQLNTTKKSMDPEVKLRINNIKKSIPLPPKVFSMLQHIIKSISEGKSVTIMPTEGELSTQQAADLLHVSRPHLIKLLKRGLIPFRKIGSHRRIAIKDVLNYQKEFEQEREAQLKFLAAQAQALQLGYE